MQRNLVATLILSTLVSGAPGQDVGPPRSGDIAPVATPLAEAIPDLNSHSAWAQSTRYEGAQPNLATRGAYPVGNGRVFGYLGLGARANTVQGVSGPTYHAAEAYAPGGHFGEHTLELLAGGQPVDLPQQEVRRVRGANFVVSVDEATDGLSLRTLTFAPADGTSLVRVIEVVNRGKAAANGLTLALRAARTGDSQRHADYWLDGAAGKQSVAVPELAARASWRTVLRVVTRAGAAAGAAPAPTTHEAELAAATDAARATLTGWQNKLKATAYFDTDHRKLRDLVNDWKVLMLVQRDAASGLVVPMLHQRQVSVRDSVGPMLTFLRFNMWAEAKAILVYFHQATRLLGRLPEQVPLDLDFAALAGKQIDWDSVNVGASELPSTLLLMHFWYWRVTRDHDLIRTHLPMLKRCLTGQSLTRDVLLPFQGTESWLHVGSANMAPDARWLTHDPSQGRSAHSFAAAVQYLIGIQAMCDIENGLDEVDHPERYTGGDPPKDRPGQRWLTRSFKFMQDLEKAYWLPEQNMFAPALSPVNMEPHRQPFADANLMPLWIGWTFPSGERSRDNLASALKRLWQSDGRIGSTPTSGYARGDTQGKLVVALGERDAKQRFVAVDALLKMAEPAGEWADLYGPDGRPATANRCRPGESGVNVDALLFALAGIRFVTVPNWDARDVRAELRLPGGSTYVTMRSIRKDNRDLDLYWRDTTESMTEDERKANEEKAVEKRRDPTTPHRRMRFRLDLNSPNPKTGYYDVGLNAACTLFVRYLQQGKPVEEVEYWAEDANDFLPASPPAFEPAANPIKLTAEQKVLVLTGRNLAGELCQGDATIKVVDTGLPMVVDDLATALVDEQGARRVDQLFVDWQADAASQATGKPASFWSTPRWSEALAKFASAGGQVLRPQFVSAWRNAEVKPRPDGGAVIALRGSEITLTATITADTTREAVLRLGSSCSVVASLNGQTVCEHTGNRQPVPDLDSGLVKLNAGANTLKLKLRGDGEGVVFVRVTDSRGLPVAGVR